MLNFSAGHFGPETGQKQAATGTNGTGQGRARDTETGTLSRPGFRPVIPCDVSRWVVLEEVEKHLESAAFTAWHRAFVVGVRRHVDAGREVTDKQADVLRKMLELAC